MQNGTFRSLGMLAIAMASSVSLWGGSALADTITFNLSSPNSAISAYPAPYATVTVNRTDATHATFTFQSLVTGGYQYMMGDGGTVALNINASSFTVGAVTESNSVAGFTATFDQTTVAAGQQEDGFGKFNLTINNFDGFGDSATNVSFTVTNTGGTWANAASALIANAGGSTAASHIFVCAVGACSTAVGTLATGFAANGSQVPEPTSLLLLGSGLAAFGILSKKRKQASA